MWGNENAEQTGDSAGLQGTGRAGHRVRRGDAFAWRVAGEVLVVFLSFSLHLLHMWTFCLYKCDAH